MFPKRVFVRAADVRPALHKLRVMDVRYSLDNPVSYGITEFKKLRVAGASFVDLDQEITAHDVHTGARHPLPDATTFVKWCMNRGVGRSPVLCYDDQSGGMAACRLWWMLDAVGVEAYVLDGGIQAYIAEGLPTASGDVHEKEEPLDTWDYDTIYNKSLTVDEVPANAKIVDGRFAIRFNSTIRPYAMDPVPGHIPGAVNHPWNSNLDDSVAGQKCLLPEEQLRQKFLTTVGGEDATHHVFTCASGVTACINIALVKHLGLGKPFLYSGAWSEYATMFRGPLQRDAVDKYGMCFTMKSKVLAMNPLATDDNCIAFVDGQQVKCIAEAPADIKKALSCLHVGEHVSAMLKSGATHDLEVRPKH